jgi:hypothetical protein
LGCNLCTPHICKCNAKVDKIDIHGLSCSKSSDRFFKHTEIYSIIINRSLTSIHGNSTLEPNGLSRDDGKRPDGITLVPWTKGQPLVWDVTIVDTLAGSYVLKTSEVSGFAAELACKRKHSKYSPLISSNYIFKVLVFETLGPWCKKTLDFINVIGNRLIADQAIQNQRNSFSKGDFPCHSTWKRCKHSGHFSRFRIICVVKQKCYVLKFNIMFYIFILAFHFRG